jgi:4-aminobutyrate aminotransferase
MLKCFQKGLLLLSCGESTLRFCPPLIVKKTEVDAALAIFDATIGEVTGAD